jgi:uncharacterized protein YjbJ (UPF0337 family)
VAFKLELVSDVKSFLRGTADVGKSLDDVSDSLDDLARDAGQTSTKMGREFDNVESDAKGAADTLERKFRDAFDDVKSNSRKSFDAVGDNAKDGYKAASRAAKDFEGDAEHAGNRASETTGEFKDEARQNFAEVASSFSGDMNSATDLVQGTLGGLAGSIPGGLGLALGGLAIAGGAFVAKWQEAAEKTEQRISDMYDDMIASGAEYLSKDYISTQLQAIYQGADDAAIKVSELRDLANGANISEPLLARALVGDAAARAEVTSQITSQRLKITDALDAATARGENIAPALSPAIQALQDIEDNLDGTAGGFKAAQENADAARQAIAGIIAPTDGAAQSADNARSKFDGLGRMISSLPPATVVVHADTSQIAPQLADAMRKIGLLKVPVSPQFGKMVP